MQITNKRGPGNYQCPKCHANDWEVGEIRVAGGFWSSIFDLESKRFASITCSRCTYTEFYRTEASGLSQITDFFFN